MMGEQPPESIDTRPRGLLIDRSDIDELREGFLSGCVKIVKRGDRIPDMLMDLVARELGLPDAYFAEDETGVGMLE